MVTAKVSKTGTYGLARLQVGERTVMDTMVLWLPHTYGEILIGHKHYVGHLNKKLLNYF